MLQFSIQFDDLAACILTASADQLQAYVISCKHMMQESDEAGSRLLQHSASSASIDERLTSSKGASSSSAGCLSVLQEGFTEGIVSIKEAAVYISQKKNRYNDVNFRLRHRFV